MNYLALNRIRPKDCIKKSFSVRVVLLITVVRVIWNETIVAIWPNIEIDLNIEGYSIWKMTLITVHQPVHFFHPIRKHFEKPVIDHKPTRYGLNIGSPSDISFQTKFWKVSVRYKKVSYLKVIIILDEWKQ